MSAAPRNQCDASTKRSHPGTEERGYIHATHRVRPPRLSSVDEGSALTTQISGIKQPYLVVLRYLELFSAL